LREILGSGEVFTTPGKLGSLLETAGFRVEKAQLIRDRTKALYLIGKKK
jgi:hypothetical protein